MRRTMMKAAGIALVFVAIVLVFIVVQETSAATGESFLNIVANGRGSGAILMWQQKPVLVLVSVICVISGSFMFLFAPKSKTDNKLVALDTKTKNLLK